MANKLTSSSSADAARKAAAEAARRAAAAEAARKAAAEAARQAAAAAAKRAAEAARPKAPILKKDEMSNGKGSALKARGLAATGGNLNVGQVASEARRFSVSELMAAQKKGVAAPATAATTLRTEVLGDGQANCFERAVKTAKPGDSIVMLSDENDPVGHAVVQQRDGSVVDPNDPKKPYASLDAFQESNPRYGDPVTLTDQQAEAVLKAPPGAKRDGIIRELGLDRVANRKVADGTARTGSADSLERNAATEPATGPLSAAERTELLNAFGERATDLIFESPAALAAEMAEVVADHPNDSALAAELIESMDAGFLQEMGAVVGNGGLGNEESRQMMQDLEAVAQAAGSEGARALAEGILEDVERPLTEDFIASMEVNVSRGHGTSLITAMAAAETAAGRFEDAGFLEVAIASGVRNVTEAFESAVGTAEGLNLQLASLQAQWAGALTPEQIESGIAAFREEHAEEYEAAENAAAEMGRTLPGVSFMAAHPEQFENPELDSGVDDAISDLIGQVPRLAQTTAGAEVAADALEREARGETTFLGDLTASAERVGNGGDIANAVTDLAFRGTALRGAALVKAGDLAGAASLFEGIKRIAPGTIEDPAAFDALTSFLRDPATSDLSPEEFSRRFNDQIVDVKGSAFGDADGPSARSFAALGLVLGATSLVNGVANLDNASAVQQLQIFSDALGLGRDVADFFPNVGQPGGLLDGLRGDGVGKFLGVAGAAFDVVNAAQAFAAGDETRGALSLTAAAGGLALTLGTGPVAVAGAIAVGIAALGNVVVDLFRAADRREELENDARIFLDAAGFSAEDAEVFAPLFTQDPRPEIGAYLDETAAAGETAEQALQRLKNMPQDVQRFFVSRFSDVVEPLGLAPQDLELLAAQLPDFLESQTQQVRLGQLARAYGLEGDEVVDFLVILESEGEGLEVVAETLDSVSASGTFVPQDGASGEELLRQEREFFRQVFEEEFPDARGFADEARD